TLSGRGNLRAAPAPRWEKAPAAEVQVQDVGVSVDRTHEAAVMRRRWKYLLFPRQAGTMTIPSLATTTFSPSSVARQTLRCEASVLNVSAAPPIVERPAARVAKSMQPRDLRPWLIGGTLVAVAVLAILLVIRRRRTVAGRAAALVDQRSPGEVRAAVHEFLVARHIDPDQLMRDSTERGESYRAFRSIADAMDTDRIDEGSGRTLLTERVEDLIEVIG
ncbi:MAG: hypothetical protein ACXVH7_04390, partial [Thermoanaerobaculia bacterium]